MMDKRIFESDTIAAIATPAGTGGIAVIRVSGPEAFDIVSRIWRGANLKKSTPNRARYGAIIDPETGAMIDEILATPFHNPASFTGEDTVELALHGSKWIQREVLRLLIEAGARIADRGEFTQRAFLNGKIDLAQAEGIADLIASSNRAAHKIAMTQTQGGYSQHIENLRTQLIDFASLLELELDFSEEDVEFADRQKLKTLAETALKTIRTLADSYATGRAIKEGVPVVIAGVPNAGKSTLLNALLCEDKAIVTDIPGTTRDIIEDTTEINGILFRFIDTAGLRDSHDEVERIGIERTIERIGKATIVILLLDSTRPLTPQIEQLRANLTSVIDNENGDSRIHQPQVITVLNKSDLVKTKSHAKGNDTIPEHPEANRHPVPTGESETHSETETESHIQSIIEISARTGEGIDELKQRLTAIISPDTENDITVTNARHYESLTRATSALERAMEALDTSLSADFIAQDVREALHHLAAITGDITTPDLLKSIFTRFCIGK